MKVELNPDKEFVAEMRHKLKENNNYCPCKLTKTKENKCMCKEFRDMLADGNEGFCHCGLYISVRSDDDA